MTLLPAPLDATRLDAFVEWCAQNTLTITVRSEALFELPDLDPPVPICLSESGESTHAQGQAPSAPSSPPAPALDTDRPHVFGLALGIMTSQRDDDWVELEQAAQARWEAHYPASWPHVREQVRSAWCEARHAMAAADPGVTMETTHENTVPEPQTDQAANTLAGCQAQLAEAQHSADDYRAKYLRLAAQIDNARKHAQREAQYQAAVAQRARLRELLDVVDNLERALADASTNATPLHAGVALTLRQLENVLARSGVRRMGVEPGDRFDPSLHEAVSARPGRVTEDLIDAVVQPGYRLDGELLRPARVQVVQAPAFAA
jgi:molecular chaperone GrpE